MVSINAVFLTGMLLMVSGIQGAAVSVDALLNAGLVIHTGEIRLDGTIETVDRERGAVTIHATTMTLPDGTTPPVLPPLRKTISLTAQTSLHRRNDATQKLNLADLKSGAACSVVGTIAGTGTWLTGREVAVDYNPQELAAQIAELRAEIEALRNARPNPPIAPAEKEIVGQNITKRDINDLIAALRREFADEFVRLEARTKHLEPPAKPAE